MDNVLVCVASFSALMSSPNSLFRRSMSVHFSSAASSITILMCLDGILVSVNASNVATVEIDMGTDTRDGGAATWDPIFRNISPHLAMSAVCLADTSRTAISNLVNLLINSVIDSLGEPVAVSSEVYPMDA